MSASAPTPGLTYATHPMGLGAVSGLTYDALLKPRAPNKYEEQRNEFSMHDLTSGMNPTDVTPSMLRNMIFCATDGRTVLRRYQLRCAFPLWHAVLNRAMQTHAWQWPRQTGKSMTVAATAASMAIFMPHFYAKSHPWLRDGISIGCFAPDRDKATDLKNRIVEIMESTFVSEIMGIEFRVANGRLTTLSNGANILAATASASAKCVEGLTLNVAIVDETQAVSEFRIIKSIRPMLSSTKGSIVYLGTASSDPAERGFFYEMTHDAGPGINIVSPQEVYRTRGTSAWRQFLKEEIRAFGFSHPDVQSQYFNKWDTMSGKQFMFLPQIRRCRTARAFKSRTEDPVVIGIDVGKINDSTVVTVMDIKTHQVLRWLAIVGDGYRQQDAQIKAMMGQDYPNCVGGQIDANGTGNELFERLTERTENKLEPLAYLTPVSYRRDERNQRLQDFKSDTLARYWTYPVSNSEQTKAFEKEVITLKPTLRGNVYRIDHPSGGHSDYVDSVAYALELTHQFDETHVLTAGDESEYADELREDFD